VAEKPLPSVWIRDRASRARQPLSRELIVSAAIRLLDSEGPDALSMRRLGAEVNAGATSLYRHVADRSELIELVVDQAYGEIEVAEQVEPTTWRASVIASAHSARTMILRHPWIASWLGEVGMAHLGPNVMRLNDAMLAMFEAGGFGPEESDRALSVVMAYVVGTGVTEAAYLTAIRRSGCTEDEWNQRLWPAALRAAEPHPRLHRVYAALQAKDPQRSREDDFSFGLDRILDGFIAARNHG
jgi:AcrR family transcriptional regulator